MINTTLMKKELKSNWKITLIFLGIVSLYISVIVYMYSPGLNQVIQNMMTEMSEMFKMFGMDQSGVGLLGFCIQYLYGFILLVFPIIFILIIGARLVSRYVDTGSMAYLLATPNTRKKIVKTQWTVFNVLILVLVIYIVGFGLLVSGLMFPNEMDVIGFLKVNFGLWSFYFCVLSFIFFVSCLFNEADKVLGFGGFILFFSYILQAIANMGSTFEFVKYFTVFTLFNPSALASDFSSQLVPLALLIGLGTVFSIFAFTIFEKKDLPL